MALYNQDSGRGSGLALVPKLKYDHVFKLSSLAKMRVDLAAQVRTEIILILLFTAYLVYL